MGTPLGAILLHALFLASGFSGLVYEVVWERWLRLGFGVSTYSVAVVTAAFMGGLSCGYAAGRSSRLHRFHPLRVYALAEAAIALYALAFAGLYGAADGIYLAAGGALWVRVVLAFVLLFVPTTLMGMTLPVATRWLAERMSAGKAAAGLFAANTAGGVAGALGAGWFFLRVYGAAWTNELATTVNLAVALCALGLSLVSPTVTRRDAVREGPRPLEPSGVRTRLLAVVAFVVGFQTMTLQVVWNRTLVCVVESNTTSFSLILASVLLGSALGALVYVAFTPRVRSASGSALAFALGGAVLGLWILGSIPIANRLYEVGRTLSLWWPIQEVADLCWVRWMVALVPVLPAAAAGAFLLPVLTDLHRPRSAFGGAAAVSAVFAADALGSVAGSLAAGFGLIPAFGLTGTMRAAAVTALLSSAAVLLALGRRRARSFGTAALGASAVAALFVGGSVDLTRWYDGHQRVRGDLKYYREGVSGTVSVFEVEGRRELLINCIEEVPNHRDALLFFKLLAHTPMLLHGEPRTVLVNALGGGITLGAVLQHDAKVEVVELVPEVRDSLRFFAEENHDSANRTDWTLIPDDGRNYLRLSPTRYDVITADATHPAAGESWPLYTREYYGIVRDHLAAGGVFAQWLPLHNLVPADFLGILKTFRSAFPEMFVLFASRYCVLVGAPAPLTIDPAALSAGIGRRAEVAADLRAFGIETGEDLLKYVVLDGPAVDRLSEKAEMNRDDLAPVEFAELRRIGIAETFPLDLAELLRGMEPAALAKRTGVRETTFAARKSLLEAQLARREPTLEAIFQALVKLDGARSLAPRDQEVAVAIDTLQRDLLQSLAADYPRILGGPDLAKRIEVLHYARELHPDDPFLNQLLGAAFLRLERWADAIPYLERAAEVRPDDLTYQSNLAFAYEQSGRLSHALAVLDRLLAADPGNPVLQRVRRRVVERQGQEG